ncbi:hypothetical protein SAMN05216382_2033 [Sphingomonas palmae]|uniref:Uncharacterized protein n=1 Tax=Sphingomonas palmae TaxID=1855283 RepID=A0A1H7Q5M4_9SPHN|nr:hypothetical protein [Sphingomonas palmae]SEL43018.1 hypothetical protein SAMN05216382_2033 [Sphingomonas palmae]
MKQQPNPRYLADQARQRVRVGMIGLAAVVLLIGLASAIFSTVSRERPVSPAAGVGADVIARAGAPAAAPTAGNEPLAELGVTPSIANSAAANDPR